MSAVLLLKASSAAGASSIVSDASGGSLWGVSLSGTTQPADGEGVVILGTQPEILDLNRAAPDDVEIQVVMAELEAVSDFSQDPQLWYMVGRAGL